jgi:hypothetical protein
MHAHGPESQDTKVAGPGLRRAPERWLNTPRALEARIVFDAALLASAVDPGPPPDEAPEPQAPAQAEEAEAEEEKAPEEQAEEDAVAANPAETEPTATATAAAPDDDPLDDPLAATPSAPDRQELVFVDARVPDPAAFTAPGREVIVLKPDQDGIAQIASAVDGRSGIDAIHIVSHGDSGRLSLGSGTVTVDTIQGLHRDELLTIGQALSPEGDILIYACDYGAGAEGQEALALWADLTGADVAASTDATGHTELGGDWTLEAQQGTVDTTELAPQNWLHALDLTLTPVGTVGAVGLAETILGNGVSIV